MQKSVIKKGRTVEEAIEAALQELGASKEQVETKVLELPSGGLMGILSKQAKVEVTLLPQGPKEKAVEFIESVVKSMGIDGTAHAEMKEDNVLFITITGENMRYLIGRRGITLDALQYLVSLVVNKNAEEYTKIVLNTEGYREKREQALKEFADKMAQRAIKTRRRVELEPMNPYERRIIHAYLQNNRRVVTISEGEEPYRRILIEVKR